MKTKATMSIKNVEIKPLYRVSTGIPGFDQVLGGGLVRGSLTILFGMPGTSKTTLALQALDAVAAWGVPVMLFTEQTANDINAAHKRLGLSYRRALWPLKGTDYVLEAIERSLPGVCVIDSLDTIAISSKKMSTFVEQLRTRAADGHTVLAIMRATKRGDIQAPAVVSHLADTVIEMGSYKTRPGRYLDATSKNRFASTYPDVATAKLKVGENGKLS